MRRLWPEPTEVDDLDALVAAEERPPPTGRPWLLVNMIASLDGAITVGGRSGGLGRPADRALFRSLRAAADVILVGAGTVRAEGYGPARPDAAQRAARLARGQTERPAVAVVTLSLELDLDGPLFAEAEPPTVIVTCDAAPAERRRAAAARTEVLVVGHDVVDLPDALAALGQRGADLVTCEGGPRLNGDLIAADLVDEWDLTLAPLLVGERTVRSSSGPTPAAPRGYELARLLEGDGLLLGRWVRQRAAPASG